ncbi:hypothetical protein Cva_01771 [Caedimonas varicaedens]|uniref:Uncharacterized protein n=1 Tax=Caedimonas varicaedens TaxID=1629334 RepID=A0A0K8MEZ5_9PROT|nr:hypothetical protein Cva_01771 [Caedimonas varicaedens]
MGENNFTQLQLTAAEELTRLGQVNFMAPQLTAAEALVSTGQLNFTDVELRAAEIKCAWPNMSQEQRALAVVDSMFNDERFRSANSFPAAVNEQTVLKDFFINSLRGGDIRLNPLNSSNIRANYQTVLGGITKASMLLKYEQNFHFPRQDAKDFYDFNARYQLIAGTFPLVEEKRLALFRSLKQHLGGEDWQKVQAVLMTTLNNSLPMDHDQWPDFERDGAANFDDFINQVISPTLAAVRASPDLENDMILYVTHLLELKDKDFQARLQRKISDYVTLLDQQTDEQLRNHGHKRVLAGLNGQDGGETFGDLNYRLKNSLYDLDDNAMNNPVLQERINFTYFCADPLLCLLKGPDKLLNEILNGARDQHGRVLRQPFGNIRAEVRTLTDLVYANLPAEQRVLDEDFEASFATQGYGLADETNASNHKTVARLKRLYEIVANSSGHAAAAQVLYRFGAENFERCIDGKRDRVTELEKQYVYVAGGAATHNDFEAKIGLNLAKLFMDHRTEKLRQAINTLYDPNLHGRSAEPLTYAWFRSHRALTLAFGLPGEYEEIYYGANYHTQSITPLDFITKYFQGGDVRGHQSTGIYHMEAFTVDKMANLVLEEIKKSMGGLFDDVTLDYMVNSDLAIRKAYTDFQNHVDVEAYENGFFKDPRQSLRNALKPSVIKKVLNRYSYIYERDEHDVWR